MTNDLIKNIYVTGVAGMIGSNLASRLLNDGFNVVGVDNLWLDMAESLSSLLAKPNFSFTNWMLQLIDSWATNIKVNIIIHVADIVAGVGVLCKNRYR